MSSLSASKMKFQVCVLSPQIIQVPQGRFKVLAPELTRTGPYPIALIPGQFQEYYKRYIKCFCNQIFLKNSDDVIFSSLGEILYYIVAQ